MKTLLPRDSYRVVNLGVVEKPHDRNRAAAGETFTVVQRSETLRWMGVNSTLALFESCKDGIEKKLRI